MKVSFLSFAAIMALAVVAGAAPKPYNITEADLRPYNLTVRNADEEPRGKCTVFHYPWSRKWYITLTKVWDPVDEICDALWAGLARLKPGCNVYYDAACYKSPEREHENGIDWIFATSFACNRRSVASAFWEATKNKYGALDQDGCKGDE